ncbi:MAG: HAMP domain-containing histidine kinase [Bacteroidetes bacterium]|nr:HAMP domain-containing histidine kinase [Bacteroidota bacterium]
MPPAVETYFASPGYDDSRAVEADQERLRAVPHLVDFLEAFPTPAVILNPSRQIVLHNGSFAATLPAGEHDLFLGLRPGDALGCINAADAPSGCGTGEPCRMCGAVLSILQAQTGERHVEECRITVAEEEGLRSLDYRVYAVPLTLDGRAYTILTLMDISDEKRRRILERIFFHDVLNTAGGLRSIAEVFRFVSEAEQEELIANLESLSNQLIEEIEAQRDLLAAEQHDLPVSETAVSTSDILEHIVALYRYNRIAEGRELRCINVAPDAVVVTDATLLARALGNLTKNALEATADGNAVTLSCGMSDDGGTIFSVHNPGVIPESVRLQMFQRSFSTKGPGRGLGTYSVRLLVERYLEGRVRFTSTAESGTRFEIHLPPKAVETIPQKEERQ